MKTVHETVCLSPWKAEWTEIYEAERQVIYDALSDAGITAAIIHVGSTSVENMVSKPVLDILVCPGKEVDLKPAASALEMTGYRNLGECGRAGRYFLTKGDEPDHTFYLHLCEKDNQVAKDQILFQKLVREEPVIFSNYIDIKRFLAYLFHYVVGR